MAKEGSKERYKEKYGDALKKISELEAKSQPSGGDTVDFSRLDEARRQRLRRLLSEGERLTRKTQPQVMAACLAYMAENTRSGSIRGLISSIKHTKGTGLR